MPDSSLRPSTVLVIGGSGAFGARLVAGLVATTDCAVIIAGRDLLKAEAAASRYPAGRVRALRLDTAQVTPDMLAATGAQIVVDTAGPFQGQEPRLARAAIRAGLSIVDLADARDYIATFSSRLDTAARQAGVVALTGASSTPALSNAVLDAITGSWQRVEAVSIAIVPGNRAPRGLSVMRAILSYAGRPVRLLYQGVWQSRPGWGLTGPVVIPGLGRRWASLCETPDLDIVPVRYPQARTVLFRAGLELSILHFGLWLVSLPVRVGLLASLEPFARPFLAMAGWFERFGSDRGGMIVTALGRDAENRPTQSSWSLVAEAGDGPFVPTLPALAVIRRLIDPASEPIAPGARACIGILPLAAIEAEMSRHRIHTRRDVTHPDPLFVTALGRDFEAMPAPIRALHEVIGGASFSGQARVERGRGLLVAALVSLFRLPKPMESGPVRVAISPNLLDPGSSERWTRHFPGRSFFSTLSLAPQGSGRGLLRERFGPLSFDLAVTAHAQGLDMVVDGWRIGPVPLPRQLRPTTRAQERIDAQGRFTFDVTLFLPLLGPLVRYTGWLAPEHEMPGP